ncbi:MAG: 16S rRNA (guanine(527)-N(7))-methyltransferase RsmG [Terracidiphilus sp.]|nr:16S rRNA (guanine(527)-N(7))-methyltransferase RsmG [Terracidiphilus sp.]
MEDFNVEIQLEKMMEDAGLKPLDAGTLAKFATYLEVFERWNARVNLSAVRDAEGILQRHFIESIACAQMLPAGISTLLDFGSGGGFPGIPVSLCRPEIQVTLAESQGKKAAFLQEAVRQLGLTAKVHSGRAEELHERFDCVTLRAVDHMGKAVETAAALVSPAGFLALMTTGQEAAALKTSAGPAFRWDSEFAIPGGEQRILALGKRLSE